MKSRNRNRVESGLEVSYVWGPMTSWGLRSFDRGEMGLVSFDRVTLVEDNNANSKSS